MDESEGQPAKSVAALLSGQFVAWVLEAAIQGTMIAVVVFLLLHGAIRDMFMAINPLGVSGESSVVTVGIDYETLHRWSGLTEIAGATPRDLLAELVDILDEAGSRVIVLDILMDQSSPYDELLSSQMEEHGRVILGEKLHIRPNGVGYVESVTPTLSGFYRGHVNLVDERAIVFHAEKRLVRSIDLAIPVVRATGELPAMRMGASVSSVLPSMSLQAAYLYQQSSGTSLEARMDSCHLLDCSVSLEHLQLPAGPSLMETPAPIMFSSCANPDAIEYFSAADVLEWGTLARHIGSSSAYADDPFLSRLKDKVVVVGKVGDVAPEDMFVTPCGFPVYLEPDMSGFKIHALAIDTILRGHHPRSPPSLLSWILTITFFGFPWLLRRFTSPQSGLLLGLIACGSLVLFSYFVFVATEGMYLEITAPILSCFASLLLIHTRLWALEQLSR